MAKLPKTIDEFINDSVFKNNVRTKLSELLSTRRKRPAARKGFKYKRDWYNQMSEKGMLTDSFFLENIKDIWQQESLLSSKVRSVIAHVCDNAYAQTITHYTKLQQEKTLNEKDGNSKEKLQK